MSQEQLIDTIQVLLTAPSSTDFVIFIYLHPEVHSEESLNLIHDVAAKARAGGQTQFADSIEAISQTLHSVKGQQLRQELAEQMKVADSVRERPVAWAGLIRNYLSTKESWYWTAAVDEARNANEAELVALLVHAEQSDRQQFEALIEKLSAKFHSEDRGEEALTVELIGVEVRAAFLDEFETLPPQLQVPVLNGGLEACDKAIEIAQALGDYACQASYLLRQGSAYRTIRYLAEAKATFERALWFHRVLAQKNPEHEPYVAAILGDLSILQRESGELDEAQDTAGESLARFRILAAKQPSKYSMNVVIALDNLGNAYREAGKNIESETVFLECLTRYDALPKSRHQILGTTVLINLGNSQWDLSKYEEAESTFKEALSRCRVLIDAGDDDALPNLAMIFNGLNLVQRDLDKLNDAEAAGRESLAIRRELATKWPRTYQPEIAVSLLNLSGTLQDLGKFEEAEAASEEAVAIRKLLAEKQPRAYEVPVAKALINLGNVRRAARRLDEAEAAYEEALRTYERLAAAYEDAYEPFLAVLLNNLSNLLLDLERFAEAEAACRKSLTIRQGLETRNPGRFALDVAMTFMSLGNVLFKQRRLVDAEAAHEEALSRLQALAEMDPRKYRSSIVMVLNNLGVVKRDLGKHDEAKSIFERAVAEEQILAEASPQVYEVSFAYTLNNLATLLSREGQIDEARATFEEALRIIDEKDLADVSIKIRLSLAGLAIRKEDWNGAELILKRAIDDIESLRIEVQNFSRRSQWLDGNVSAYENLLQCLLRQGTKEKLEEAIVISERGKSRAINDLLATREFRPKDQALAQELDHWLLEVRKLEDRENYFRWRLANGSLTDQEAKSLPRQLKAVHRDRLAASEKLEQLGRKIRKAEPDFLPYAQTLSLEEIKQLAHDADATLLLFRVAEFGSVVFLVFPDGNTDAVQIETFDTDTLSQLMVTFEDGQPVTGWSVLYIQKRLGDWTTFIEGALERLYVDLMEPVHRRMRDLAQHMNGSKRLVMVPNRALTILPLHACWWKEDGIRKYLLDEYVCAYAPSLYILNLTLKRKTKLEPQDRILGFANPHFDDPKANLLYAEWECREIQKLFGNDRCRVLWREQATKERFLADANQSQILHFSCHGMYEMAMPLQSSLFLADAPLEAGEIMSNLDLRHTWLTVLSACETSLSDYRNRTDEQYGLPLGFLVAGTATVWGTLWKVDDLSTSLIMKEAYLNLKAGMNKPEALRAAQISVRDMAPTEIKRVIEEARASARLSRSAESLLEDAQRIYGDAVNSGAAREKSLSHPYQWAGMQCLGI